jgi:5-methylcytosine-specific restriction endonuclease McrA
MARVTGERKLKLFAAAWGRGVVKECHYCGCGLTKDKATLDHVIPLARRKGTNEKENIVICCKPCNTEKGTRPYEEFKAEKLPEKQARRASGKPSIFSKPWA